MADRPLGLDPDAIVAWASAHASEWDAGAGQYTMSAAAGAWVPGTVYPLAIGAWPKAIVLAVWGAAVVSSVDNFLRPRLVAGRVGLSRLAMFVAMLGGLQAFGALGIILGPVLFATASAILAVLRDTPPSHPVRTPASKQEVG